MKELATKVVETAASMFGYKGQLICRPSQELDYLVDNPVRRCPDISKARGELGYEPTILIDEGLRRSLAWYSHNRDAAEA